MKKKSIAWLLTAALCATSFAPVYGAEFTCAPEEETAELFQSGEAAEPEENVEEVKEEAELSENRDKRECLEVVSEPKCTHFIHKLQVQTLEDIYLDGMVLNYYDNNGTLIDTVTFVGEQTSGEEENLYSCGIYKGDKYIDYEEELSPGEYEVRIKLLDDYIDAETSVKIYVDSPETSVPEIQKTGDATFESDQPVNEIYQGSYVQFTPEVSGYYYAEAECNQEEDWGFLKYRTMDEDYGMIDDKIFLEQGTTYYFSYMTNSYTPGMTIHFSLKSEVYIAAMEWVEKPVRPLYSGVNVEESHGANEYAGVFSDGKIKIIYSDGTEEIVPVNGFTKNEEKIDNFIEYTGSGKIEPGIYKAVFKVDVYDGESPELTADVEIKSPDELPTIENEGSKTVPFEGVPMFSSLVRFKTGAGTEYKMHTDIPEDRVSVHVKFDPYGAAIVYKDDIITLKPNTVYYLSFDGNIEGAYENITYTVTPAKVSISQCKFEVPKTATYTGKAIRPKVKVIRNFENQLKVNRDYTVTYSSNKNIGTGKIKITGKGSYTGSKTISFTITPGKTKIKTAKRSSKGQVSLTWSKAAGASGYLVARSTNGKKWTKAATVKSTSFTDKKAKKGTAYQYKVRAYKKVGKKTIYGPYSSVKKVK